MGMKGGGLEDRQERLEDRQERLQHFRGKGGISIYYTVFSVLMFFYFSSLFNFFYNS